jgi:hypothetical protein
MAYLSIAGFAGFESRRGVNLYIFTVFCVGTGLSDRLIITQQPHFPANKYHWYLFLFAGSIPNGVIGVVH